MCRTSLYNYHPPTALNHMSRMPGFDKAFHTMLYKRIQKEADVGCRTWQAPTPSTWKMEDVEKFDSEKFYEKLCITFPDLLTSLAAVATKKRSNVDGVQVSLR